MSSAAARAADQYIAERMAKRTQVIGIAKHIRYTEFNDAADAYAGVRHVDGQAMALLRRGDEMLVLPIDEATARRLGRVAVGEVVTVTRTGTIKTKGRSR